MELQLKHLVGYLPYGLKVCYEGILNGKELSEYEKLEPKEYTTIPSKKWMEWNRNRPKEILGKKTSEIKMIKFCKGWQTIHVGRKHGYLKTLGWDDIKPILRPLSDLTESYFNAWFVSEKRFYKQLENGDLPYIIINELYEEHFDVHNLIPNGLAININDLNK